MVQPLKIFISSPGDVVDERRRAALVVSTLKREFARFFDISAVLWEYEPMLASGHFQDVIDPPSTADIVVMILWSRLGTPLPDRTAVREYKSLAGTTPVTGTEWEYEQALEAHERRQGIPDLLVYRKFTDGVARFSRVEELDGIRHQWEALQAFWHRYFEDPDGRFKAAFNRFTTLDEFQTQLEQHLRELVRRRLPPQPLRIAGAKPADRIDWWSGSPYRGLQAFDMEHAVVFFGRERAQREITEALVRRAGEGAGFMLVLGASGSGKSSLVRAGVLPDLVAPGVVAGVSTWRHLAIEAAELAPDPFASLAAALLRPQALPELAAIGYREAELADQFRSDPALAVVPLRLALQRAAAEDYKPVPDDLKRGRLVLVLDQLEGLFTAPAFTDDVRAALDRLLARLAQSGLVWIVATLRSDFYHRMVELPALNALAAGQGQYLLAPPSAAEIEQIITRPAEVSGLAFEAAEDTGIGLAAVIREAAARDPASLPLLSFMLDELYRRDIEQGGGNVLTHRSYAALGQLEGAIARHADALVAQLPPKLADVLPTLLLMLIEIDEIKGTATARTVRRAALTETQRELADRLVASRLAVADDIGTGETVRPAHEALLTQWPLLAKLVEEHREFLIARRRLQADAASWERHQRDRDLLLPPGLRLEEARDALTRRRGDLDPEIIVYAQASIAADDERISAAQRARDEALQRELTRSRRIAAVVSVLLVMALAAGGFAWWQRSVATAAQVQAENNYRLALNQATGSLQLLKERYDAGDITTALLQSLVGHSQEAVKNPPSDTDTDEVTTARIQFLDILSLIYVTVGNPRAITTAETATALANRLVAKDPANQNWLRLSAFARGQLSDSQKWLCHADRAAQQAQMGADVLLPLLQQNPSDEYVRHRLYTAYATIGDSLRSLGDLDGADRAYQPYIKDTQSMLAQNPDMLRWQSSVAFATVRVGDLLLQRGRYQEAEEQYKRFFSVTSQLVARSPRESNFLSGLVQAHQRLGDLYLAQGDLKRAEIEYRQYLQRATVLSNLDPSNFRFREIFAHAHQRLGDLLLRTGNHAEALREFGAYHQIAQGMLSKGPANNGARYNAANARQKVGDALRESGDLAGALREYDESLIIARELSETNCNNGTWQRLLPLAHQRLGMTFKLQGDRDRARMHFLQCMARPVATTVWSPAARWPQDVTEYCRAEAAELGGGQAP